MSDLFIFIWERCSAPDVGICSFSIIPALISGAAGLAATIGSTFLQNALNKKNWSAQNRYNSPREQVSRLLDAGLSPALMYQNAPSNSADSITSTDIGSNMSNAFGAAANALTMSNLKAQNKLLKSQTRGTDLDNRSKELDNQLKEHIIENDTSRQMALENMYVGFDENGNMVYGNLDSDGAFTPEFDAEGNYIGKHKTPDSDYPVYSYKFYQAYRDAIREGFYVSSELFNSKLQQIETALKNEFGRANAQAAINSLKASAKASEESARGMKLDNDIFNSIGVGGKVADGMLRILLSVLLRK